MSHIPYVIDNEAHKLADVLNSIMAAHPGASLDIATAYFTLTGKSKVQNYLGDYQKSEGELSYDALMDVLFKNKGRLGVSLTDARFTHRLQDHTPPAREVRAEPGRTAAHQSAARPHRQPDRRGGVPAVWAD